ncbi:MAG: EAL domain-containing protein [Gammaproteobacteria bacterium]|nr:EAL domain-containing protein [Gammaproteobacteria bacterium]
MKLSFTRLLLILFFLFTSISVLYVRWKYEEIIEAGEHRELIKQIYIRDIEVDDEILRIASLAVIEFDTVNAKIAALRQFQQQLAAASFASEAARLARQNYLEKSRAEVALIEKLKTEAALTRNSLYYLPTLLEELDAAVNYRALMPIVTRIYGYTLLAKKVEVDSVAVELRKLIAELKDFGDVNNYFYDHLKNATDRVIKLESLYQQYEEIASHNELDTLYQLHQKSQNAMTTAGYYQLLLLLPLDLLLLFWLLWMVQRNRYAEQRLTAERQHLQVAVDVLPEAILLFNREGQLTVYNAMVLRFYPHLTPQFLAGLPNKAALLRQLELPAAVTCHDFSGKLLLQDDSRPSSYYHEMSDGRTFLVKQGESDGGEWVILAIDITHSRSQEKSLYRMEKALHQSPVSVVITDPSGNIEYVNPKFEQISGYQFSEVVGKNPRILKSGETSREGYRLLWQTICAGQAWHGEFHNRRRDGKLYWESASISPVFNDRGEITHFIGIKEDITERKRIESSLRIYSTVFDVLTEGIVITDSMAVIKSVNPAYEAICGYAQGELLGQSTALFRTGEHDRAFYQAMWQSLSDDGHWSGEVINRRKNGAIYPAWLSITRINNDGNSDFAYVAIMTDLTQRKEVEEQLRYRDNYDQITGLPNRTLLQDRLEHGIAVVHREKNRLALLFVDLDRFKGVNDTYGHSCGDALLQQVAKRLQGCVREGDTVSRFGSDEFMVLLEALDDVEDAVVVAKKVLGVLSQPFNLEGNELFIGASIGIALYPDDAVGAESLISNADIAMSQAKSDGRNRYHFFTEEMHRQVGRRMELENDLRRAVINGELELHYQPVIHCASGEVHGVEALLRWNHPELGMVPPGIFVPLAEESDIIGTISVWVLQQACEQGNLWRADPTLPPLDIAVNLSCAQFEHGCGVGMIDSIINNSGYPTDRLTLEVTESLFIADKVQGAKIFTDLKALGVRLSIDDFGTGYSSLSYLKHFPVDVLKIDRSFIGQLAKGETDEELVRAIVVMSKSLGLAQVAEGVETQDQYHLLREIGCDYLQGYYFGKPMSATAFLSWLRSYRPAR